MYIARNILVIDDEISLRRTLARILRQAGWEVITASNGPEALGLLAANQTDLVFLDLRLPDMNGLEVLKEIRRTYTSLPVVLLTGYGSLQTSMEALRLGVTDYLLKPIKPDALLKRTSELMKDQVVRRRRSEIESQIELLKAELESLDSPALEQPGSTSQVSQVDASARIIKAGSLSLDPLARHAALAGEALVLTPGAFEYLVVLMRHSPAIVEYQTLVLESQGFQCDPDEARDIAKRQIHQIRAAFEKTSNRSISLITERNIGYRLVAD
ncbi:MAG: response regulator transcription factor [Anaerolineaceae bacterium]|nr:response regulator transcription factor [Anaerolineaceae bacterium]